jgi:hypothetical protein
MNEILQIVFQIDKKKKLNMKSFRFNDEIGYFGVETFKEQVSECAGKNDSAVFLV